jgi:hypothetical protein
VIANKHNKEEWVTIEYTKGFEASTQPVKRKMYNYTKSKLELLGYLVKII